MQILIENYSNANQKNVFGVTSLHLAAENGKHFCLSWKNLKFAEYIIETNFFFGHGKAVEILIKNGAQINLNDI